VARLSDGSVVCWGDNQQGQCDVPDLPDGTVYVEVVAGWDHTLARRCDGVIVCWGNDDYGQCQAPAPSAGVVYTQLAAGWGHSMALRSDGVVVAWGDNQSGQCNVPALPPGLMYTSIGAGRYNGYAIRSDGDLVAWESDGYGQCQPPDLPPGVWWRQVDGGSGVAIGLRSDGRVAFWGYDGNGPVVIPPPDEGQVYAEVAAASSVLVVRTAEADDCGSITYYCTPGKANSVSPTGAILQAAGCPSHDANSLELTVIDLPPGKPGIFFYGPFRTGYDFGNGHVCVGGLVNRIPTALFASQDGSVTLPIDLQDPLFTTGAGAVLPGSTWNFQFWYRDPGGGLATFNLSNAVEIVFAP
jgi:hypothetical protein